MAKSQLSRRARRWNEARDHYQQLQARFAEMGQETPFDVQEETEMAIERAMMDFIALDAPTLDGVCERIQVMWGDKLFSEEDDEMEMLRQIVGNLRQLEMKLL